MRNGTRLLVIVSGEERPLTIVATGPDFLLLEETNRNERADNKLIPVLRSDVRQVWAIAQTDLDRDCKRTPLAAEEAEAKRAFSRNALLEAYQERWK